MARAKKRTKEPCNSSPDNVFCDALRTRCARAAVRWLKVAVNIQKPIASLTLRELEGMTEAITAEWIAAVLEQKRKAPEAIPDEIKDIFV